MKNIKMTIAYHGSTFMGWQKTREGLSVEGALEESLEKLLKEKILLQAASRTDCGVHAEGQVVNFFTQTERIDLLSMQKSLNYFLSPHIAVKEICEVPLSFHSTLDAVGKEYHYFVSNSPFQDPFERGLCWHVNAPLDKGKMEEAASFFVGTHDFSSFCNMRKNLSYKDKIRTIYSVEILENKKGIYKFVISGKDFLYKMVRNLVGTLVYVGKNKLPSSMIPHILSEKKRYLAGPAAPAHGLFLAKIYYPKEEDGP